MGVVCVNKPITRVYFLWKVAFLITVACPCFGQDTATLLMIRKVPIMEGTINGKHAYFLIDTGASITVLSESEARHYGFKVYTNQYFAQSNIAGIGGESKMKEVRSAHIKLGCRDIRFINKTVNIDKISRHFRHHNIRIAGIIGADLLSILGCKIDYKTNTIVF